MTEVPEFMRAAMEAAGMDPDEVAQKAAEIEEAGGIDALPLNDAGRVVRRPVDEPETEPLFEIEAETATRDNGVERDNEGATGKYAGLDATDTEWDSGAEIEADRAGPIRRGTALHTVLIAYGDGDRLTAYDASMKAFGDWHGKRRESTRLEVRGYVRKSGTLPNRAPAGREHVDAYVITDAGRDELERLADHV